MKKYRIKMNGNIYEMEIELISQDEKTQESGETWKTTVKTPTRMPKEKTPSSSLEGNLIVKSPMPGRVLKVLAEAGDTVKAGQVILILEAMKMENEITSLKEGKLSRVCVKAGQSVANGEILFEVE